MRNRNPSVAKFPSRWSFNHRPLRFEPLEDRRMLAGVTVGNNLDLVNGNTTSIADLIANDGGDGISLREAVLAANATPGADEITFDAALSGQTIMLGGTELAITQELTIDARALAEKVTINANQLSRILNITALSGNFMFAGLTLVNGKTFAQNQDGGALKSESNGNLEIVDCHISGSSTTGRFSDGGGIFSKSAVTIRNSTMSKNFTDGDQSRGGGIASYSQVTLTDSVICGNVTKGYGAAGGGVSAFSAVTLTRSVVSGNRTMGDDSAGGGIYTLSVDGEVKATDSEISDNHTVGKNSWGGGI